MKAHTCRSASPIPNDRSPSPPNRRLRLSPTPSDRGANSPSPPPKTRSREDLSNSDLKENGSGTMATSGGGADAAAKAEFAKLLGSRSGGAYIPPARLRALQAEAAKDKASPEYQRLSWDALRKSINGLINKVSYTPSSFPMSLELICRSTRRISSMLYLSCLGRTLSVVKASSPGQLCAPRLLLCLSHLSLRLWSLSSIRNYLKLGSWSW